MRIALSFLLAAASLLAQSDTTYTISTVAGSSNQAIGDGGVALQARVGNPSGVAVDTAGNIFIAEVSGCRIRKVNTAGVISTVGGTGRCFSTGDGGPALQAEMLPNDIALDRAGNIYFTENQRVRKISTDGTIRTIAGNGVNASTGDGGPAISASFITASGLTLDTAGNIYVVDSGSSTVRKVSTTGTIATVAGGGRGSFGGDGGPATAATMSLPTKIALDAAGNIYVTDTNNARVRKVTASTGIMTTIAGTGSFAFSGDGGQAASAGISFAKGVAVAEDGTVFIGDGTARIRRISTSGVITTVAGGTTQIFGGDGGPALSAGLGPVFGITIDDSGALYLAAYQEGRIRKLTPRATGPQPQITRGSIVNAASFASIDRVAPGEIITIFGSGLGPASIVTAAVAGDRLTTKLGGTRVLFDGVAAPMIYSLAGQVSAIVPYGVAGKSASNVQVEYNGVLSVSVPLTVQETAPGIFRAGNNIAVVVNQDGKLNSVNDPAPIGSVVVFFMTGEGQTNPPGEDGKLALGPVYPAPVLPITAESMTILYAGAAPGFTAGLLQVNARVGAVTGSSAGLDNLKVCAGQACDTVLFWVKPN
jgi:uncharacterized protein (TIGR03437 family)